MGKDVIQALPGILVTLELDINQRILKLLAKLLRNRRRLVTSSDRNSRTITCQDGKHKEDDQSESGEKKCASAPGFPNGDVRFCVSKVFRHEFYYILTKYLLFKRSLSSIHNFTSNLTSDQMMGRATSPPTIIPSSAVNTAEPGTKTARK